MDQNSNECTNINNSQITLPNQVYLNSDRNISKTNINPILDHHKQRLFLLDLKLRIYINVIQYISDPTIEQTSDPTVDPN